MTMKTSTLRLRSVRMKHGGAEVRVINKTPMNKAGIALKDDFAFLLQNAKLDDIAGYAIVIWENSGKNWVQLIVRNPVVVPKYLAPAYIHDQLLLRLAEYDVDDRLGPKPSEGA